MNPVRNYRYYNKINNFCKILEVLQGNHTKISGISNGVKDKFGRDPLEIPSSYRRAKFLTGRDRILTKKKGLLFTLLEIPNTLNKAKFLIGFIVLLLATCAAGCVSRKLTINSQPQGAKVFFDYKQVGETPCSFDFIHYGGHHLELVKEGYENLNTTVKLKAPIYEYIPLDFLTENILPFHFKDEHTHTFSLTPGVSRLGYIIPERKKEEEGEGEEK